jgi:DNA-binding transcriptional LysR family regulator
VELRHLRSFVAVAEELHFGRAAERLYILQPALSKQISALERELGVRLFERTRREVVLTDAGRTLLADARRLLAQADGAAARALRAGRGDVGVLAMGFIAPALYDLLPRVLRAFRTEFPDVRLELSEVHNHEGLEAVASRRLHLAFLRLPVPERAGLRVATAAEEPVVVALPADDPMASQDGFDLAELARRDIILIARGLEPELHDYYIAACMGAGFSPRVVHEVDRTHVAVGLVAGGLGIAFVPASARLVPHPGVAYRPLRSPALSVTFGAVWATDDQPAVLQNFVALRPWGVTTR